MADDTSNSELTQAEIDARRTAIEAAAHETPTILRCQNGPKLIPRIVIGRRLAFRFSGERFDTTDAVYRR